MRRRHIKTDKRLVFSVSVIVVIVILLVQGVNTLTSTDLNPAASGSDPYLIINANPAPTYPIAMEHGVQSGVDNTGWTTVNLSYSYTTPVVVATPSYSSDPPPLVTRIQNASGSSFDVRVQRADNLTTGITGIDVHWIVVEAGTYDSATYGVHMEAGTFLSTVTDENWSWVGQLQTAPSSYTAPVVLGQVMTYVDTEWSVFWARGSTRLNPPDSTNLWIGKHVGEDPSVTRSNETLGYIIFEAGSGSITTGSYEAAVGGDTVRGWTNSAPYTYTHSVSAATTVILSAVAMDGADGGWPILDANSPVSATDFDLILQEDDKTGSYEQNHSTEEVAYVVLD